jgi:tRNA(Ile)-lysidine synthase TilS/MesJ
MEHIISKKPMKRRLNPTCNVPQDELELYCRIKGLSFRRQEIDANLSHLFNDLKNIRPGSLFSMQRIKEKLEAI